MRRHLSISCGMLLLTAGYLVGASGLSLNHQANAFDDEPEVGVQLAKETQMKVHDATIALQDAMEALESEGRYNAITDGVNSFLVLSGGGDALADLESGHGVDPETFAALYAGQAIEEVSDHLARDEQGRITYKGKVVRMYSQSKLEESFNLRTRLGNPTF